MDASAKQMAELEEQLIHERSRGSTVSSKLERESERRETVQGELDKTKQVGGWLVVRTGRGKNSRGRRSNKLHESGSLLVFLTSQRSLTKPSSTTMCLCSEK